MVIDKRLLVVSAVVVLGVSGCPSTKSSDADSNTGASGGIETLGDDSATQGSGSQSTSASTTTLTSGSGGASNSSGEGTAGSDGNSTMQEYPDTETAGATAGTAGGSVGEGSVGDTNDPDNPLDCGGTIWECGDGIDNDGDELIDLSDKECTGPCDNDEGSFQTGIPGDNMDCKQDCFFDGNSGQGDDKCNWDLRCDEENPGEFINCEYTGGSNCGNGTPNQTPFCESYCGQFTPPGCDCFGCCTVQTDNGEVHIFLNGSPDCSFDNLKACTTCTPQIEECGNPCEPEECEVCFGEEAPPEGCEEQTCDLGPTCDSTADCASDWYCLLGCCMPPPPG